jgi:hypothetical protein
MQFDIISTCFRSLFIITSLHFHVHLCLPLSLSHLSIRYLSLHAISCHMLNGHAFDLSFNITHENKVRTPMHKVMKEHQTLKSHKPLITQMCQKSRERSCHDKVVRERCNYNQNIHKNKQVNLSSKDK